MIGPGALGLLLGGLLQASGRPVVFVARSPESAERLGAVGLTLIEGESRQALPLDARAAPPPRAAAVLLCVKVADTEAACAAAREVEGPVVVLQNGLGRGAAVAAALGQPERVVVASTRAGATRGAQPGEVIYAGRGLTAVAPLDPRGREQALEVAELLEGAGLEVERLDDAARAEWEKLVVNAAINALTAIARCANGVLLEVPELRSLAQQAAEEAARCAAAEGVAGDWGPEATRRRWEAVAEATARNRSSALQDIESGRVTEVSAINGALAERARAGGGEAPVNAWLAQLVRGLEQISPPR